MKIRRSRAKCIHACPVCSKTLYGGNLTCGYACANVLRTKEKADRLDELKREHTPLIPTIKQVKKVRRHLEQSGLGVKSHELTVVEALTPKLRRYWFGLPGPKHSKMKIVFTTNFAKMQCSTCASWTTPGHKYCSVACYDSIKFGRYQSQRDYVASVLNPDWTLQTLFTAEEVQSYKAFGLTTRSPEALRLEKLHAFDPELAVKFGRLPAKTERGRHYLASGGRLPVCIECGVTMPILRQIRRRFCSAKCSNGNAEVHERKIVSLERSASDGSVGRYRARTIRVDVRRVIVQGYERQAIDYIRRKGVTTRRLKFGTDVPEVEYHFDGKDRKYFPDMLLDADLVIEVKSTYTFAGEPRFFEQNKAKALASRKSGYRFRMMVMDENGERYKLPADWTSLSFEEVQQYL